MGNKGFTLVEVMVAVAVVGIIAGVAVPNYMRFVSKSRQKEAQIALSNILIAERAYVTEINSYSACLWDIGYKPNAGDTRYYAVGFSQAAANASTCGSSTSAVPCSTVGSSTCTVGAISGGEAVSTYHNAFSANTLANSTLGYPKDSNFPPVGAGLANFSAGAVGNIFSGATQFDTWTIDANKNLLLKQSAL